MSSIDIPPPPAPWRSSPASLARDADIAALRRLFPRRRARSALLAAPAVVLVLGALALVLAR